MSQTHELPWWLAVPLCLVIGIIFASAIPEVRIVFEQIVSAVVSAIFVGIVAGLIILGLVWYFNKD